MKDIISQLTTEQVNEATAQIDRLSTEQMLQLINEEDYKVPEVIRGILPQIAATIDLIVPRLRSGGRLFYYGAGTSGRLGVLDASECPPTYGTPPELVQGIIAGGEGALVRSVEGAEDSEDQGAADVDAHVRDGDVVVGIAASGRTPYVLGAMKRARERGAVVIGLANNAHSPMSELADQMIEAVVGPEVIMGSTRMKAGTAQKLILNMITTATMIQMGKVYGNLMVDLQPSNVKLVHRSKRIIKLATDAPDEQIDTAFAASGGHVKTAIVMLLTNSDAQQAQQLLQHTDGFVSKAISLGDSIGDTLEGN